MSPLRWSVHSMALYPLYWRSDYTPASDQLTKCYDFLNKEDNCKILFSLEKSAT